MARRLPNGYGSIIKLSGNRRKPYAVRTSSINEYINVYIGTPSEEVLSQFKRLLFRYNKQKGCWSAVATDRTREYAEYLRDDLGVKIEPQFKQDYTFHAYFERPELAYSFLAELNNGDVVSEHRKYTEVPTFAEMYRMWEKYKRGLKNQIASSTWRNYEIAFNHLAPLHNKKFVSIRTNEIQDGLNSYNHKSSSTTGNTRAILKAMYS